MDNLTETLAHDFEELGDCYELGESVAANYQVGGNLGAQAYCCPHKRGDTVPDLRSKFSLYHPQIIYQSF